MRKFINEFLNKPISVRAPLIIILVIFVYFVSYSFIDYLEYRKANEEYSKLNFKVSKVSFQMMYFERTYNDEYLILDLENPINRDQFDRLEITLKDEVVEKELVSENQIKIIFRSPFRKSASSDLNIKYYGRNVYFYTVRNSSVDEEFRKLNPIIEPIKY